MAGASRDRVDELTLSRAACIRRVAPDLQCLGIRVTLAYAKEGRNWISELGFLRYSSFVKCREDRRRAIARIVPLDHKVTLNHR
jgi:hypothetical protein